MNLDRRDQTRIFSSAAQRAIAAAPSGGRPQFGIGKDEKHTTIRKLFTYFMS